MDTETEYLIYRWVDEGEMTFVRRMFIRHEIGEQITAELLRERVEVEVYDFKPALYRAIPRGRVVDFEVKGEVVLS